MESTVPLDAHGNPISADVTDDNDDGYHVELDETARLTSRVSGDFDDIEVCPNAYTCIVAAS